MSEEQVPATVQIPHLMLGWAEPTNPRLQDESLMAWVLGNRLTTNKGLPMEFAHSPWLPDIYEDTSPVMCIKKSSQARISTYAIYRALHFAMQEQITIIFTEPTRDDAQKFSSSRVTPILTYNPWLLRYVGGGTELRRISQEPDGVFLSHIHFRGTFGEKEAFTIDSDFNILDEVDLSNREVLSTFDTRLIHSRWKRKLEISTPSLPNYGISASYNVSDQMTWLWKCQRCNRDVNPRDEYFNIIDRESQCCRCPKCGKILNRSYGRWVPAYPSRSIRGYSVSMLMYLYVPVSLVTEAEALKKPRKFANFYLGKESAEGVAAISRDLIEQKCFLSRHARSTESVGGGRVMGVDQGDVLYYEVGEIGPEGRSLIVELGSSKDWGTLGRLMQRHEIEVCVIDARPEKRLAREFAHEFPGRVYFCEYATIPVPVRWKGDELYHIKANRTEVLDAAAEDIASGAVQLYMPMDEEIDQDCTGVRRGGWIQHWCNQNRIEPEEPDGLVVWKETGPDHRSHADVLRKIAESKLRQIPVNEVWVATGGRRSFGRAESRRPVVTEEEIAEQARRVIMGRPVVNLRSGQRRR